MNNTTVDLPSYSAPSEFEKIPKHVAIIMDGNGRWAEKRRRPRIFGHVRGCSRVREVIREADRIGIQFLTLYAFSQENWGRPTSEVNLLMRLLHKWLVRQRKELIEKNVRFRAIGNISKLPQRIQELVFETEQISRHNTGLQVTLALSYSAQEEIVRAAAKFAEKVQKGEMEPGDLSPEKFSEFLFTSQIGDPDLLIRTSGEQRLSNFLLWQLAYSEIYFTDTMWPDFKASDLRQATDSYARRQRRYGLVSHQLGVVT